MANNLLLLIVFVFVFVAAVVAVVVVVDGPANQQQSRGNDCCTC